LLLCHGTVCVVGKMRDLILQLSKSSIYSTKPCWRYGETYCAADGGNLKYLHRAGHCNNGTAVTNKRTSSSEVCAGTGNCVTANSYGASVINHELPHDNIDRLKRSIM
ncbi:hypothetical protein KK001_22295, partial [Enterobacter roggenkampii]|nr:hypothetical protein [Enterobacter roggenkampii]